MALYSDLSDIFNEEGRQIDHDLSRQNGQYNPKECDAQYTKCLGGKRSGVTYRTFFALAEKAGVDLKMYPKSHPKFEGFAPVSEEMARGVNSKKGGVSAISAMALTTRKTFTEKIDLTGQSYFYKEVIEVQVEPTNQDKMIQDSPNLFSSVLPSCAINSTTEGSS